MATNGPVQASHTPKWIFRIVLFGAAVAGLVLIVLAAVSGDAPVWQWVVGICLLVVTVPIIIAGVRLRRLPEGERQARMASLESRAEASQREVDKSRLAHAARKHKKEVLRSGVDGTARILAIEDGGRANEFRALVYLELEVTIPGRAAFEVPTGEYVTAAASGSLRPGGELVVKVDPDDTSRVAVDWDESLRLR
jgi:hypothetical protein